MMVGITIVRVDTGCFLILVGALEVCQLVIWSIDAWECIGDIYGGAKSDIWITRCDAFNYLEYSIC